MNRILRSVFLLTLFFSSSVWAASTWEQIQSSHELRIGVASGDPWYYKNPLTNQWTGVGYKIGQLIAHDLHVKMVPVETTYANAAAAIQANQIDLMLVLDPTAERKKAIDFPSEPLLYYKQGVLMRSAKAIHTWSELNRPDVKIGVALGTATDRDLTRRLPHAQIFRFTNTDETVAAFMAHRIDGIAFYHPALAIILAHIRQGYLYIPKPVVQLSTSGGLRREKDKRFKNFINQEFIKFNRQGTVEKIFQNYMKSKGLDPKQIPSILPSSQQK